MTIEELKTKISPDYIVDLFTSKNYSFQNINLIGVRNESKTSNSFDDFFIVMYKRPSDGLWTWKVMKCTTDPGVYYRNKPMVAAGTAIMIEGQYKDTYKIGRHKDYEALEQIGNMVYIRDNDKDSELDFQLSKDRKNLVVGNYKTNIHRANPNQASTVVDKWSAGCQVIADPDDFSYLLSVCKLFRDVNQKNSFDYTLINISDIL
jgi:hypothetical protein